MKKAPLTNPTSVQKGSQQANLKNPANQSKVTGHTTTNTGIGSTGGIGKGSHDKTKGQGSCSTDGQIGRK